MFRVRSGRQPYGPAIVLLALGVLAAALAVLVVGWMLDVATVRSVFPDAVSMKAHTAIGLGAGALAMALLAAPASGRRRTVGLALATVPGLLGLAALIQYVFGVRLGIDELPFTDHVARAAGVPHPGRLAPSTGACFVALTGALLALDRGGHWRWRPSELFAIPMGIVAFMSLIGYAYAIPDFYGPASAAKMAVHTALCLVALAVALPLARPRGRFLELATTTDPGGVMVRRMVPLCVVVPLVLGWLHLRTVGWGMFDDEAGTWWLAATTIAGLVAMMWWCAGTLSSAHRERRVLELQLLELASRDGLTGRGSATATSSGASAATSSRSSCWMRHPSGRSHAPSSCARRSPTSACRPRTAAAGPPRASASPPSTRPRDSASRSCSGSRTPRCTAQSGRAANQVAVAQDAVLNPA